MDPYSSPNIESDSISEYDIDSIEDHPRYDSILKMVIWGEEKEDIFQRFEVNKVSEAEALLIYNRAIKERVDMIRSDRVKELVVGVILMIVSVLVFAIFWFGFGFIPRILIGICAVGIAYGAWKFANGLGGYISAPSQKGSLAE